MFHCVLLCMCLMGGGDCFYASATLPLFLLMPTYFAFPFYHYPIITYALPATCYTPLPGECVCVWGGYLPTPCHLPPLRYTCYLPLLPMLLQPATTYLLQFYYMMVGVLFVIWCGVVVRRCALCCCLRNVTYIATAGWRSYYDYLITMCYCTGAPGNC